jgi:HK97 gp10 family phage protein
MADVTIKGGADLAKALAEFPVKLEAQVMQSALRGGANVIAARARSLVPVNTGELRKSIKVRARKNKRTGFVNVYLAAGGRRKGDPFYAHMVEFGTAPHEIRPKGKRSLLVAGLLREVVQHPGAAPRPFLRPAFDSESQRAVDEIGKRVGQGIKRIVRKQAKAGA